MPSYGALGTYEQVNALAKIAKQVQWLQNYRSPLENMMKQMDTIQRASRLAEGFNAQIKLRDVYFRTWASDVSKILPAVPVFQSSAVSTAEKIAKQIELQMPAINTIDSPIFKMASARQQWATSLAATLPSQSTLDRLSRDFRIAFPTELQLRSIIAAIEEDSDSVGLCTDEAAVNGTGSRSVTETQWLLVLWLVRAVVFIYVMYGELQLEQGQGNMWEGLIRVLGVMHLDGAVGPAAIAALAGQALNLAVPRPQHDAGSDEE